MREVTGDMKCDWRATRKPRGKCCSVVLACRCIDFHVLECATHELLLCFPQASTTKFFSPQLLHNCGKLFCCPPNRHASECVQRIRGNSQVIAETMLAVTGGSRRFSRVNCRGELETRASADRLPGHCGLLKACSLSRLGCWLPRWLWSCVSPNRRAAISTGKSGTHRERCRAGAVDPLLLAAGG